MAGGGAIKIKIRNKSGEQRMYSRQGESEREGGEFGKQSREDREAFFS